MSLWSHAIQWPSFPPSSRTADVNMLRSVQWQSLSIFRKCQSWHLPFTVLDPSNMFSAHKMSLELQKRRHVVYVAWTWGFFCFFLSGIYWLMEICSALYFTWLKKNKAQHFETPLIMFKVWIKQLLPLCLSSGRSHVSGYFLLSVFWTEHMTQQHHSRTFYTLELNKYQE